MINTAHSLSLSLFLVGLLALSGCGDKQQGAVKSLHQKNLKFTVKDFHASAAQGDLEGVRQFLEAGMEVDVPDESSMTALIRAAENDRPQVVAFLIEQGARADIEGPNQRTALIGAAQAGADEVVRILLKGSADPYQQDVDDWSAITLAAYKGHVEAVKILAPKSTDLLDDALLVSAFEGSPEVMDVLLNHGAYVNARSPNNQTALMIAAMNGHEDGVKLLLHNGANRYALDSAELTAANLADGNEHYEIAELLNLPPSMQDEMFLPRDEVVAEEEAAMLAEESDVVTGGQELVAGGGALGATSDAVEGGGMRTVVVPEILGAGSEATEGLAVTGETSKRAPVSGKGEVEAATAGLLIVSAESVSRGSDESQSGGLETALVARKDIGEEPGAEMVVVPGVSASDESHPVGPVRERSSATPGRVVVSGAGASPVTSARVPMDEGRFRAILKRQPKRVDGLTLLPESAIEGQEEIVAEPAAKRFRMTDYREQHLPVMLKSVGSNKAEVRVLYRADAPVAVKPGEMIADTGLEVVKFEQKFANSKQGGGHLVDVSQMIVIDRDSGQKHLLVKDLPAKSSETYAVMRLDGSDRHYDVRIHDEFVATGADSEDRYRVIDVRPTQVVIENLSTEELYTIPRAAAAMR
jgi:ankyrin repeat protein